MQLLYTLFIYLLALGMEVFSWFNEKARNAIQGRRNSLAIVNENLKGERVIWMHAASLGEYEQGLPVLAQLKKEYPQHKVLVTFFSPSGYENVVKKQHIADAICYLPFDRVADIKPFISTFQTDIFFTIKYDFWYHLLRELKQQGARTFVVSALFYERQVFFKPYGKWFSKELKKNIDWFFHQTEHSVALAKTLGLDQSSVSGDTRFDRVKQIRERDNSVPFIEEFKGDKSLLVIGSSWEAEEHIAKMIADTSASVKIIIAPHDIKRSEEIISRFQHLAICYSHITDNDALNFQLQTSKVLIIDSIGLLSKIYSYADVAVVGGGFHSAGLHNILEAATFGVPVVFGNHYKKNPEADALIIHQGGKSFANERAAVDFILTLLSNQNLVTEMSRNARDFIDAQPNAVEIVMQKIVGISKSCIFDKN